MSLCEIYMTNILNIPSLIIIIYILNVSQSFYASLSPVLCEKLVCGQRNQTMYQEAMPINFVGRIYVDVFRSFISRNVRLTLMQLLCCCV
jgi:hypothetical protein